MRITRRNNAAFPLSSSTSAVEETEAQRGHSRDPDLPSGSHSNALSAPFATFLRTWSCGERGSVVTSREVFQKPEGHDKGRPDLPLCPYLCH